MFTVTDMVRHVPESDHRRGDRWHIRELHRFRVGNTIESAGTLSNFDTTHTNYAAGAGEWDPAATPESKTYRITVELDAAAPDAEQGESVTAMSFTWEVQS